MLKVFAVGSCRIHRPLRRLDDAGQIVLLNRLDPCWFGHTSGFAKQFVDVVTGRKVMPKELRPLIAETTPPDRDIEFEGQQLLQACHVVVVEISSIKVNLLHGWDLNLHLVSGAKKNGSHANFLEDIESSVATPEQIWADLTYIRRVVDRPLVTVDHLHFRDENGNTLWGRDEITDTLQEAEKRMNFHFYSTRKTIEKHGQSIALKDHGHYNDDFELIAGKAMLRVLKNAASSTS